jgi:predicted RNA methylase
MTRAKTSRSSKRQLGQFMTPPHLVSQVLAPISITQATRVLEPSFGDGAFLIPLIEKFLPLYSGTAGERLEAVLTRNVFGVEIDPLLYEHCLEDIQAKWGPLPRKHNLVCDDYFLQLFVDPFDVIVGNPPFGGTITPHLQEALDRRYGVRHGHKIKKETYAFFLVKCLEELGRAGTLRFICSDTFLTIPTMKGLRKLLLEYCEVRVQNLDYFSGETAYPTLILSLHKTGRSDGVIVNGTLIHRSAMDATGNFSWAVSSELTPYFAGPKIGDYAVCSSGMTTGKNEYFVREISEGSVLETFEFYYFDEPITVAREVQRARYNTLSPKVIERIRLQEAAGTVRRNVYIKRKNVPDRVYLPHADYRYYNKSVNAIMYAPPSHAIYWRDEGDAVKTFKKNGAWYLHGVGGMPFFEKEGLTWQLVASSLNMRYLPPGYILDSGAPCAFLRSGVGRDELYFLLGWCCTAVCSFILKTVINHTVNIQSKAVERLPYPWWVPAVEKELAIRLVKSLVARAMAGESVTRTCADVTFLEGLYRFREGVSSGGVKCIEPMQGAFALE